MTTGGSGTLEHSALSGTLFRLFTWQGAPQVFGGAFAGVLGDALLFYFVAVLLLTYLGAGISALLLPKSLRPWGWMLSPYLGFSVLVVASALMVAFGANVRMSLVTVAVVSTASNFWALQRARSQELLGPSRRLFTLLVLTFPSYAITAVTMAHNGSLGYVGGQGDVYLLVPLAEWLKAHSAPLFSLGSASLLNPHWNGNVPPLGGWSTAGTHLDYAGHRPDDANFLFQRGSRYLESSLGLVLGWDSSLVFRPAQAFMLALSIPAAFTFCRQLVRASLSTSALAALLVGLNGTTFFWALFGHPGQTVGLFLVPVATAIALLAVESQERLPLLGAALPLSALVVSYYQGVPLVPFLVVPGLAHLMVKPGSRNWIIARSALIAFTVFLLTLPEQVKLALVWQSTGLPRTSGWGYLDFPPLSDAFGTTLHTVAFNTVTGRGQVGDLGLDLLHYLSMAATVVAVAFAAIGLLDNRNVEAGRYRSLLLGALALLAYLRLSAYPYGYAKALAGITFLFAVAIATGLAAALRAARNLQRGHSHNSHVWQLLPPLAVGMPGILLITALSTSLALSSYISWKPVGNIWNLKTWQALALNETLPTGAVARLSPNVLADPESAWMALYFLRNQLLEGPFAQRRMITELAVAPRQMPATRQGRPDILVLGASEVGGVWGLTPSDLIWEGSLLKAYKNPSTDDGVSARTRSLEDGETNLPVRLPAIADIQTDGNSGEHRRTSSAGTYLLITLAAESPATIEVETTRQRLSLQIGSGMAVRSIPIEVPDHVTLVPRGDDQAWLLSVSVRADGIDPAVRQDYPKVLAAVGNSALHGTDISTRFLYLDIQVPASHSIDVFDRRGNFHPGWFKLPTNPDGKLKDIRFNLDGTTLEHRSILNGVEAPLEFSIRPLTDGEYTVYFSIDYGAAWPVRIPLYQFRLGKGQVTHFQSFPLTAVWNGRSELSNWK